MRAIFEAVGRALAAMALLVLTPVWIAGKLVWMLVKGPDLDLPAVQLPGDLAAAERDMKGAARGPDSARGPASEIPGPLRALILDLRVGAAAVASGRAIPPDIDPRYHAWLSGLLPLAALRLAKAPAAAIAAHLSGNTIAGVPDAYMEEPAAMPTEVNEPSRLPQRDRHSGRHEVPIAARMR